MMLDIFNASSNKVDDAITNMYVIFGLITQVKRF